jgi:cytidylate kinase
LAIALAAKDFPEVDYKMDKRTLKYAMEGNVVLDARLSGWVAGDWTDVKIFFECPLEVRAKRVAKRDNISVEQAKKNLKRRDEQDHEKYQKLYNIDSFDTSIYNTIINNEKLKKEETKNIAVEIVKKFLETH